MTGLHLTPLDEASIPGAPGTPDMQPVDPARESLLAGLRAKSAQIERTRLFNLPKYDGLLVARYRRLPWAEITELRSKDGVELPDYSADFLARAVTEVLARDPATGELHQLDDTGFTRELLAQVGRPARESAAGNLKSLLADEELLWIPHAMEVGDWMTSPENEAGRLGE